jgi:hypothetical protein
MPGFTNRNVCLKSKFLLVIKCAPPSMGGALHVFIVNTTPSALFGIFSIPAHVRIHGTAPALWG